MTLQRLSGNYQMVIAEPGDLAQIAALDEARWFATSVPIESLTAEETFLKFVDSDGNGRIWPCELQTAQAWLFRMLTDRARLADESDSVALDAMDTSHEEGATLRATAGRVLANLGASDAKEITLAQVRNRRQTMACAAANGDGVIPPQAAEDPEVAAFISDAAACMGTVQDASGVPGITEEGLNAFLAEARAYLDWHAQGQIPEGESTTSVMVFGSDTPKAAAALEAVRDKVDAYFALCALVALDPRAAERARLSEEELAKLDLADTTAVEEATRDAPLASPTSDYVLRLTDGINPAWKPKIDALAGEVLTRLGAGAPEAVTRAQWNEAKTALAPYAAWVAGKKGAAVEKLGCDKLRTYLEGPCPDALRTLILHDKAVAAELARVADLEKLILYQMHLMELANNMVSFPRFYDPDRRSMIEVGTVVMGGRRFKLNVKVKDRAAHKKVAQRSHICIMYLAVDGGGGQTFEVACGVTAGEAGDMFVGRRGLFITRDGKELDAVVVDVIANPVGLWEAFKSPFVRLSAFVGKFTERFSGARSAEMEKQLSTQLDSVEKTVTAPPQGAKAPGKTAGVAGIAALVAGGGVAIAALGSSLTYVVSKIAKISPWQVVIFLLAIFAIVAIPTIIAAIVKLRRRNMSALLEACGWAVNYPMRLSATLGRLFTETPDLPEDAHKQRVDLVKAFLAKAPRTKGDRLKSALLVAAVVAAIALMWYGCSRLGLV